MYNKKAVWAFVLSLIPVIAPVLLIIGGFMLAGAFDSGSSGMLGTLLIIILILFLGNFVFLIISLILAIFALKEIDSQPDQQGKGLAIAAIVIDGLLLLGSITSIVSFFVSFV